MQNIISRFELKILQESWYNLKPYHQTNMKKDQMIEHALVCPQCNAPLKPSRFASSTVCHYCGTTVRLDSSSFISAKRFHEAFRVWNSPQTYNISSWISLGDRHWALGQQIGRGEISDVYKGQRARWPTELVIIKILRDQKDRETFDNEWNVLQTLHQSKARGADDFTALLPQFVFHGEISADANSGKRASIFRWISGFQHTFEDVMRAYPQGIPPRASIWVWRRILETLSFVHASGMVHGAVLPPHLLIQENDHGVRLVGYGSAGRVGEKLRTVSQTYASFYPQAGRSPLTLTPQLDLAMSARSIIALLGGDMGAATLPAAVPAPLADVLQRVARTDPTGTRENAWEIRTEIGELAKQIYGPPQFAPIVMPS